MRMEFEWDEAKSERNFRERGFGYDFAALIFDGPVIEWCDIRKDWREIRIAAVGSVEGRILTVIYTDRNEVRRIISARRARKKEVELWQSLANR
ncbi:MAG TPA: BrnT family toxin [Rhizomicrobium sp.]|nr:BrnT family toxin [Rhizomicrobium sp.]